MQPSRPVETDIVLLGAGHAHVEVLRRFATRPEPGVRLTLIGREPETPYSGISTWHRWPRWQAPG
jgi:selenide,water dikinase